MAIKSLKGLVDLVTIIFCRSLSLPTRQKSWEYIIITSQNQSGLPNFSRAMLKTGMPGDEATKWAGTDLIMHSTFIINFITDINTLNRLCVPSGNSRVPVTGACNIGLSAPSASQRVLITYSDPSRLGQGFFQKISSKRGQNQGSVKFWGGGAK